MMFTIVVKNRDWTVFKKTLTPDDGFYQADTFAGLKFSFSEHGCASASFSMTGLETFEAMGVEVYDSIDIWALRHKTWQGRVVRPINFSAAALQQVECEGMAPAWARSDIRGSLDTNKKAWEIYQDCVTSQRHTNLVNSDTSLIQTADCNHLITKDWAGATTYEEVFNTIGNYGFDDLNAGEWGILPGKNEGWISDQGNRFYWRKRDLTKVDAVIPFALCQDPQIAADMQEFATSVRVKRSGGLDDVVNETARAKYTPGSGMNTWAVLSIPDGSSSNATQAGNIWLGRHASPWVKGQITLGADYWEAFGLTEPPFLVRAGMNVQLPGLTNARPDLVGLVTDSTSYRIMASEYDVDKGENMLTLNDYPDRLAVFMARLQAAA